MLLLHTCRQNIHHIRYKIMNKSLFFKSALESGEIAQHAGVLLYKHETLSSNPHCGDRDQKMAEA